MAVKISCKFVSAINLKIYLETKRPSKIMIDKAPTIKRSCAQPGNVATNFTWSISASWKVTELLKLAKSGISAKIGTTIIS